MKIIPLHNRVVLELEIVKEQKHGAILVAEKPKETGMATIVGIGPDVPKIGSKEGEDYPYLTLGARVIAPEGMGAEMIVEDKKFLIIPEDKIFAIIEEGE